MGALRTVSTRTPQVVARVRWRPAPATVAIAATTVLALALRLLQFTRGGSLTGIVEYDDGPYVGSAILLTHGILPYRDYIFVQPPGSTLLLSPVAMLARVGLASPVGVMATGRVLTAMTSAAGVWLLGLLIRHRGIAVITIGGGVLAVYTGSIEASHTVLVEPWLVLFCLAGALAVFHRDHLTASTRRLAWGGVLFGFGGAVEAWAIVPVAVIIALCLPRLRRAAVFAAGVAGGFLVPVLPFAVGSPRGFYQGVITAQIGSRPHAIRVSPLYRFKLMTGLDWLHPWSASATLLTALAVVGAAGAATALGILFTRRLPPPLDWFAVTTAAVTVVMFLVPSQFHYHFTGFLAPFLALSLALPAGRCADAVARVLPASMMDWPQGLLTAAAVPLLVVATVMQGHALTGQPPYMTVSPAVDRLIPAGACVLSDTSPVLIAADRLFSDRPGCVILLDSMGADLQLSHGLRPDTGAWKVPAVEEMWWRAFRNAQFVWLKYNSQAPPRVPWTPKLRTYFHSNFRLILQEYVPASLNQVLYGLPQNYRLYARRGLAVSPGQRQFLTRCGRTEFMTGRALVLGGGGITGVAWELGLLADLAAECDRIVALAPVAQGFGATMPSAGRQAADLARGGRAVALVTPDPAALAAIGHNMLDAAFRAPAARAGYAQAASAVAEVAAVWDGTGGAPPPSPA